MKLYLRLAWRNIWRHKRRTLIVMIAIGLTMTLMMFYDGIVAGFEQSIYGNAIKVLGGNIQVYASGHREKKDQSPLLPLENPQAIVDAALAQPQVVSAAQRIQTGGLATSREGAFPISIIGIQPEVELEVNLVAQNVSQGRYLKADDGDVIFIGKGLAEAMNVALNDRIIVVGRDVHNQMRQRTMTVIGIYDIGMADIEKQSIYISLAEAQDLYGLSGQTTEVAITLKKLGEEPAVISAIQSELSGIEFESWQTSFPELRAAIQSKGAAMNVFAIIILIVSGIGILNMLLMAVYERTREIGMLGALGMKPGQITGLFLLEGTMIGVVGVVFGVGLGILLNFMIAQKGMDYSAFAGMTSYTALLNTNIYPTLGLERIGQRVMTTLVISILAAFIPAREAAHHEPAEALHYV